jgi:hypothetical protein
MGYDPYRPAATDQWDFMAQVALWRERAIHQSQRAEHYKALAEALKNGTTITKEKA